MLTRKDILSLLSERTGPCVSLFMPTHRTRPAAELDPIRFKNLLRALEESLLEEGRPTSDVTELLAGPDELRSDSVFWQRQSDGLACFVAPGFFLAERLPFGVGTQYEVGDRFYVRPLLPLLDARRRFFILALSQDGVRFYEATPYSMEEVPLGDGPGGVTDLIPERRIDSSLHFHSIGSTATHGRDTAAIYHGHDVSSDKERADLLRFLRAADRRLHEILRGEDAPLVLACVGFLASLFETVNTYPNLLPAKVPGNPNTWTEEELHAHAWQVAEPSLRRHRAEARHRFEEAVGQHLASARVEEIVPAADEGRVDTLFLAHGSECPGSYNPDERRVRIYQGPEDLAELAATRTLANGGQVYAVDPGEVPGEEKMAAIFRYPINRVPR